MASVVTGERWWQSERAANVAGGALGDALARIREPLRVADRGDGQGPGVCDPAAASSPCAFVAPCPAEALGDAGFCRDHGMRLPYVCGAMANGIASVEIVQAMGHAGMLGMFGAAGLAPAMVEDAVERVAASLGGRAWGFNLIHSPFEPDLEAEIADLYVRRDVTLVSASAYLGLTLPLVRYRVHGIHQDSAGRIITPNRVIAKVSRVEIAEQFWAPPPAQMLAELVRIGHIDEAQARLAARVPVAQDITVEADSGGHTDNRPALALFPSLLALRDRLTSEHGYGVPLRAGAAGGISTPHAAAAAFAMGAAYVLTGSVNQACVEAGTSDIVRQMLAESGQADVTMAPAADMFEMGVKLQVLKRGTLFPMRAQKLYDLYRTHAGIEDIPAAERESLEKSVFRQPLDAIWDQTRAFWAARDPAQIERAERDEKHRMALVFRWYLGKSSHWANSGDVDRKIDFQIWAGPAIGAFNEWTRGSHLEDWHNRRVLDVALNLLHGAAVLTRSNSLRTQGVAHALSVRPRPLDQLEGLMA